jgi:hypothetical protein
MATPANATLITNSSATIINTTSVFNVKAYGAAGDGVTNDGTAIAAAITALLANSAGGTLGTLYFPAGYYLVSSAISITLTTSPYRFTVRGDGMASSIIYQTGAGADGMTITLPQGSGNTCLSSVEVRELGFQTSVAAACALRVTYGSTASGSTEYSLPLMIHDIDIGCVTTGFVPTYGSATGWNNGVYLFNPWKVHLHNINGTGGCLSSGHPVTAYQGGAGSGTLYSSTTAQGPTSGVSYPGGGALITIYGGTNINISDIYGSFWACGIFFGNQSQSGYSTSYLAAEGVNLVNVNLVAINIALFLCTGYAMSSFQGTSLQLDFGDASTSAANYGIWLNGDTSLTRGNVSFTTCNITNSTGSSDVMVFLDNINYGYFNVNIINPGSLAAVKLTGTCTYNLFDACIFRSNALIASSACSYNQANNTQGSTTSGWTGVGIGNTIKTTLF